MKELSDVTCCVVDSGLFLPVALRMRDACKRVIYWSPDQRAFPSLKQGCIGDGFEGIERVEEFWRLVDDIDLFMFPDSSHAWLQLYLEATGKAVWGSREGQDLEQKRLFFMRTVKELGLDVAPYQTFVGLDALREHLSTVEDVYVKVSHWRGDMETKHWRSWALDSGWLDWLAVSLGPLQRVVRFLVFEAIETHIELGSDTYCVDGQFPSLMINGVEGKDKSYFGVVTKKDDMPEQLTTVLNAFSPMLSGYAYRNQISTEVRVSGDKAYFIDFTGRGGMPSTSSQLKLWSNFPEIVWHGAHGILVDPVPRGTYSIETMITSSTGGHDTWESVEIPKEIEEYCLFSNCAYLDGCYIFPPDDLRSNDLGWMCVVGDSPQAVLDKSKEVADQLPDGLNADVESLASVIQSVEEAHQEGITVSHDPMPEPAQVL